jgi:hypothetical protein
MFQACTIADAVVSTAGVADSVIALILKRLDCSIYLQVSQLHNQVHGIIDK